MGRSSPHDSDTPPEAIEALLAEDLCGKADGTSPTLTNSAARRQSYSNAS
jgi:hypothetical protein